MLPSSPFCRCNIHINGVSTQREGFPLRPLLSYGIILASFVFILLCFRIRQGQLIESRGILLTHVIQGSHCNSDKYEVFIDAPVVGVTRVHNFRGGTLGTLAVLRVLAVFRRLVPLILRVLAVPNVINYSYVVYSEYGLYTLEPCVHRFDYFIRSFSTEIIESFT